MHALMMVPCIFSILDVILRYENFYQCSIMFVLPWKWTNCSDVYKQCRLFWDSRVETSCKQVGSGLQPYRFLWWKWGFSVRVPPSDTSVITSIAWMPCFTWSIIFPWDISGPLPPCIAIFAWLPTSFLRAVSMPPAVPRAWCGSFT